jgi:general secretion pathway protein B
MSLILEALKKSERQRRLGESPSLGSPIMAVRRRRSMLPILIALIAAGLLAVWWLRRDVGSPEAQPVAATTSPAATAKPGLSGPSSKPADGTTFNDAAIAARPATAPPMTRVPRDKPSAGAPVNADAQRREKIRSGERVVANAEAGAAATVKESEPVSAGDPAALAAAMARAGQPPATTDRESARPGRVSDGERQTVKPEPEVVKPANVGSGESMKLMWELPLATRRNLPEIKLSMHVFSKEPAQRFVIINGERRAEGDDVEGLKLIEIRTDGVVFESDGVRFLYPRGGR